MKKTTMFIVTFLATILISSSVPLYLYLNAPKNQGSVNPEAPSPIVLNKFSSYEELKNYVEESPQSNYYMLDGRGMEVLEEGEAQASVLGEPAALEAAPSDASAEAANLEYSTTNIQVEGVDEADIIKTDGEFIYLISNNTIIILKAYPTEEAEVLSRISFNGTIRGIFINEDKLAVFEDEYGFYAVYEEAVSSIAPDSELIMPSYETPKTYIKVYDISDRKNPVFKRDFAIDGNYFNSRMIGDYVYVIANQYTYMIENDVVLPKLYSGNETEEIPAIDIYYYNVSDYYYTFTSIVALNVQNDTQEPTHETVLLGGSRAIYVSMNNIYLTFPEYPMEADEIERTAIHRIGIDKDSITFEATGVVPGYVLNQFSMSEHNGYFRIATTSRNNAGTFRESTTHNNIYVLDMDLNVVGKLEDLAPDETIYSARFIGDRCYLVTFEQIDPFFVIDVADPTKPKVLGYLKIPGYSDYLHPYDENHIIGIGEEDGNLKLSLFDVTDVTAPAETAKYLVQAQWSYSLALQDHKAFLFDKSRQLLALPVSINLGWVSEDGDIYRSMSYWQGAYIFDLSLEQGFTLEGNITHHHADQFEGSLEVKRILYIDNVLYTVSDMLVKMNDLETLAEVNEIELS